MSEAVLLASDDIVLALIDDRHPMCGNAADCGSAADPPSSADIAMRHVRAQLAAWPRY